MDLSFAYADLYPAMGGVDTSNLATPGTNDQDALNEDIEVAEKSTATETSKKRIFLAIVLMCCLVVFFGGAK